MQINALPSKVDASHVRLESLAGDKALTKDQKIAEASRQFEAVLLRQFLAESQKPVVKSEFTDDSNAAGIYQDMITNQLADSLSRSGGIGLAKTFERQLTPHPASHGVTTSTKADNSAAPAAKLASLLVPKQTARNQTVYHSGLNHNFHK